MLFSLEKISLISVLYIQQAPFTCADFLMGCNLCSNLHPCVKVHLLRVHMVLNKFRTSLIIADYFRLRRRGNFPYCEALDFCVGQGRLADRWAREMCYNKSLKLYQVKLIYNSLHFCKCLYCSPLGFLISLTTPFSPK